MLSVEENRRLTEVGPGTPMGELMRRYWMPIAISDQVGSRPVARRLLGEDLVVFRTGGGEVGVVDRRCAHRRTDLSIGICEQSGIRCGYHGWLYALDGKCIEQPAEPRLNEQIRLKAYPAQEMGGLIFTYMGPQPAPLLPRFDLFVVEGVVRDIGETMLDFNWLQAMENSVDPHHAEWLHAHFMNFWQKTRKEGGSTTELLTKKHLKVGFDEFEFGIIKRRVLEGHTEDDDDWKIGHPLVFPNMLKVGGGGIDQFQIRVPIDDTHTWHMWYTTYRPDDESKLFRQDQVPSYPVPLFDRHGDRILDFIDGQDIACWAGQGVIADRSKESLGRSDVGIVRFRQMLRAQLEAVEAGKDPLGTIRDPVRNTFVDLPVEHTKYGSPEGFRIELLGRQAIRYSTLRPKILEMYDLAGAMPKEQRQEELA